MPPAFCTCATTCSAQRRLARRFRARRFRPRGRAAGRRRRARCRGRASRSRRPAGRSAICASPIFMIEPLPNCFSICASAAASALLFWSSMVCLNRGACRGLRSIARRPGGREARACPSMRRLLHRTIVRCKPSERPRSGPASDRQRPLAQQPASAPRPTPRATAARSPGKCARSRSSTAPVPRAPRRSRPCPPASSGVPPPGPATPVTATARSAPLRASAPAAIAARRRLADGAVAAERRPPARPASRSSPRSNR